MPETPDPYEDIIEEPEQQPKEFADSDPDAKKEAVDIQKDHPYALREQQDALRDALNQFLEGTAVEETWQGTEQNRSIETMVPNLGRCRITVANGKFSGSPDTLVTVEQLDKPVVKVGEMEHQPFLSIEMMEMGRSGLRHSWAEKEYVIRDSGVRDAHEDIRVAFTEESDWSARRPEGQELTVEHRLIRGGINVDTQSSIPENQLRYDENDAKKAFETVQKALVFATSNTKGEAREG